MTRAATPITDEELPTLFAGLERVPLALAVSGGADSMALMHMIARWAAREDVRAAWAEDGAPPRAHVVVLTVDHSLRAASAEEAAFVACEAEALGLPCRILRWVGEKPVTGLQDVARNARRNLMLDTLRAENEGLTFGPYGISRARALVMAHHQEDQAETLLMRLARGSGLDGLRGMRARDVVTRQASSERPYSYSVPLLRPLLGVPKARLIATLRAHGAGWIDDPSNEDERFERVRIRKALRQLEPLGFTAEKVALSARRLADAESAFARLLDGADAPPSPPRCIFEDLDLTRSDFLSHYTASRLLRRVLAVYGGAARPADLAQIEQLAGRTTRSDSRLRIGAQTLGGCNLQPHGDGVRYLRIFREGNGEGLARVPVAPGQPVEWDGKRFTVDASRASASGAVVRALGMQGWADLKRAVKGLADLGWPAAAVATVPVIECGGEIIAYPVIDRNIRALPDDKRQTKERWAAYAAGLRHADYSVHFRLSSWSEDE